jgi:hypothetical protein
MIYWCGNHRYASPRATPKCKGNDFDSYDNKINNIIALYQYFKRQLGEPRGYANYVINRVVDMYTHVTHETVKK